jgi:hypothetical protein
MNAPDATFTNGRYELPSHARGVLVLADPPEAGWRIQAHSNTRPPAAALISKPRHERNGRHACGRRSR